MVCGAIQISQLLGFGACRTLVNGLYSNSLLVIMSLSLVQMLWLPTSHYITLSFIH